MYFPLTLNLPNLKVSAEHVMVCKMCLFHNANCLKYVKLSYYSISSIAMLTGLIGY